MDMLQILAMAKNGKIVLEADNIDVTNEDTDTTEYEEDIPGDEATEDEPVEETEDEVVDEEDPNEGEDPDYTEEDTTDELTDEPTDEFGDETSEETDTPEETEEVSPEKQEDANKNYELLEDFIQLHNIIKNNLSKLNSLTETDIVSNKIIMQVKKNLTALQDALFTLIIRTYSLNTYAKNLYLYNYFTQSLAINIEMLSKISVFTTNTQNKYIKNN